MDKSIDLELLIGAFFAVESSIPEAGFMGKIRNILTAKIFDDTRYG